MTRSWLTAAVLFASLGACRARDTSQPDPAARVSSSTSTSTSTATAISILTATPSARGDAGAGSCHADTDCSGGRSCFFPEAGCATEGKCLVSDGPRSCNMAIAMCSCGRRVTFFGSGGCAGSGVREPWEIYACPCVTDTDCRGGQRCVPKLAGPSLPGTVRECRDPKP